MEVNCPRSQKQERTQSLASPLTAFLKSIHTGSQDTRCEGHIKSFMQLAKSGTEWNKYPKGTQRT